MACQVCATAGVVSGFFVVRMKKAPTNFNYAVGCFVGGSAGYAFGMFFNDRVNQSFLKLAQIHHQCMQRDAMTWDKLLVEENLDLARKNASSFKGFVGNVGQSILAAMSSLVSIMSGWSKLLKHDVNN